MKNQDLISEEITRARQLWGYDTSKTIFEQATGNTGTTGMITCYGCPGHMQPLETQQFQGPAGAPPYNPDPNMNWGNWCGFGQSSSGYISYWEDQSLVSAICNSGTTTGSTGGPTTPQREEPCEEFHNWDRMEQRDFCKGCRRAPDKPMCECCIDI